MATNCGQHFFSSPRTSIFIVALSCLWGSTMNELTPPSRLVIYIQLCEQFYFFSLLDRNIGNYQNRIRPTSPHLSLLYPRPYGPRNHLAHVSPSINIALCFYMRYLLFLTSGNYSSHRFAETYREFCPKWTTNLSNLSLATASNLCKLFSIYLN